MLCMLQLHAFTDGLLQHSWKQMTFTPHKAAVSVISFILAWRAASYKIKIKIMSNMLPIYDSFYYSNFDPMQEKWKVLTWSAIGAEVGKTILFCTAPILTMRGLRSCSSWTPNLYPASSKSFSSANFNASVGNSNLLEERKDQ